MGCLQGEYSKNMFIPTVTYTKFDRIYLRYFNLKQKIKLMVLKRKKIELVVLKNKKFKF